MKGDIIIAIAGACIGAMIGFVVGGLTTLATVTNALHAARSNYEDCIRVGAPRENCLKEHLLPKEDRR